MAPGPATEIPRQRGVVTLGRGLWYVLIWDDFSLSPAVK